MVKIKTKKSAIENVKRLFINAPNDDVISLKDAFIAWGRPEPENIEKHKGWLSNKMTHLTYHNLLIPVYSYNTGRKRLKALRLTKEGKIALGRIENSTENGSLQQATTNGNGHTLSLDEVAKAIPKLQKENPDFNIVFSFTPKGEKR